MCLKGSYLKKVAVMVVALAVTVSALAVTVRPLPTAPGSVLEAGVVYQVTNAVEITGAVGQSALVLTNGTTVIDVQEGGKLTLRGGNANGMTGGGAGVELPEKAALVLMGKGSVDIKGGNAANGSNGDKGKSSRDGSKGFSNGGAGGAGGGGAGSGIGSAGSAAGTGGAGGTMEGEPTYLKPGLNGGNGGEGGQCGVLPSVGRLCLIGSVSGELAGGSSGESGSNASRSSGVDGISVQLKWFLKLIVRGMLIGGGGGGGGGFGGQEGGGFGTAGLGGRGGGGGGAGALTSLSYTVKLTLNVYRLIGQLIRLGTLEFRLIKGAIGDDYDFAPGNNGGSGTFSGWNREPATSKTIFMEIQKTVSGGYGGGVPTARDPDVRSGRVFIGSRSKVRISNLRADKESACFDIGYRTQVTLEQGAADIRGTEGFTAMLGKRMANIIIPGREGYTFMGYYTEEDGKGQQYFLATGEPAVGEWDSYAEKMTLYAHWTKGEYCGLWVDGVNPAEAAELPAGVSFNSAKRIISIDTGSHTVSGVDVNGYRLKVVAGSDVVLSNVTIRLPMQNPNLQNDIRERPPLYVAPGASASVTGNVSFVGENHLSATEGSWSNGFAAVEVPAVVLEGSARFARAGSEADILRLAAAGGAPAIMRYADTNNLDLSVLSIDLAFDGGTYALEPSAKVFDSQVEEQQEYRYIEPEAVDFDSALVAEVVWRASAGVTNEYWNEKVIKPYMNAKKFCDRINGGSVNSGTPKLSKKVPFGQNIDGGKVDLGEVKVNLWQAGLANEIVTVTFYDQNFEPCDAYKGYDFKNMVVVDDEVRLWLQVDIERYFSIGGVLFKVMPQAGKRVNAERVEAAVRREQTGGLYPTFAAAIESLKKGPVANAESLTLLKDINETVSVEQMCNGLLIDGGHHTISNLAISTTPMFYQREDATNQALALHNIVLAGFVSTSEPMISTVGELDLFDCALANNRTAAELIRVRASDPSVAGLTAADLDIYGSSAKTALKIEKNFESEKNDIIADLVSCTFQGDFQEEVMVESGTLGLYAGAHLRRVRLGLMGQLIYRERSDETLALSLDSIQRRVIENPILIKSSRACSKNALDVDILNHEYMCENDAKGNVVLVDTRDVTYAAVKKDEEGHVYSTGDELFYAACKTYEGIPTNFFPQVSVWALRKIYLESNEIVEGTKESVIEIPADRHDYLGSCEYIISNATESATNSVRGTENCDCEPVTLDCEARVTGTLHLGNIRFSKPIVLCGCGVLVIEDEYDLTNATTVVRIDNPDEDGWQITSTRYSLEDLIRYLRLENDSYRWEIRDNRIRVKTVSSARVFVASGSETNEYLSTYAAFKEAKDNDVVILARPAFAPSIIIGDTEWYKIYLTPGTTLGSGKRITVNSLRYLPVLGLMPPEGQLTSLVASSGTLTIGEGSVVALGNIDIEGTLTLDGPGWLDLLDCTCETIYVNPRRSGLIASNMTGKVDVKLPDGVAGQLYLTAQSNLYYSVGTPVTWNFVQTDNGCGTLYVTNFYGEGKSYFLDPTNYVSIASQGLAHVQIDDAKTGFSTNLEVVVVYCDLEAGVFRLAPGYTFEYLAEGEITAADGANVAEKLAKTRWKRLAATDATDALNLIDSLKSLRPGPGEGTEELLYDEEGHIITNKSVVAMASAAGPKLMASGALDAALVIVPRDLVVDMATGKIGIRFFRDQMPEGTTEEVFFTRLLNNEERVNTLNLYSRRFSSGIGIVREFVEDGLVGGGRKTYDNFVSDVNKQIYKKVTNESWFKGLGGKAQFATVAGIRSVFTCIGNLVKNAATPVQFQGKYYTPSLAPMAYEKCIAKNDEDAAVHIQAHCYLPSYTITNGTLRISGKYEGGFGSALYGLISNGKQWTSGTTVADAIGSFGSKTLETVWGAYYVYAERDFSRLSKTLGDAVGNFVSGIILTIADPYCATPEDEGDAMLYVDNGAKLVLEDFEARSSESGAMVEVLSGGQAEVRRVELNDGYEVENKALLGVFGARTGGTLLLEDVEAGSKLTVLGVENGADVTVEDGNFDGSTFDLQGADLKLGSAEELKSKIWVTGRENEGDAFALKTGAEDISYWKNFKSAVNENLSPMFSDDRVVWGVADPIGTVRGDKVTSERGFNSFDQVAALVEAAGDTVTVKFLKDVNVPDSWTFPMAASLTVTGDKQLEGSGQDREEPLFVVSAGQQLCLNNMTFSSFSSETVPLVKAEGGTVKVNDCEFKLSTMAALVDLSEQAECTSELVNFFATNDHSTCAVRLSATGATNRTILVSGQLYEESGLSVSGAGTVPVNGNFAVGRVMFEGPAALAYSSAMPAPFAVSGASAHLAGSMYVIDNCRGTKTISVESLTVLNPGYEAVTNEDGNIYLHNLHPGRHTCQYGKFETAIEDYAALTNLFQAGGSGYLLADIETNATTCLIEVPVSLCLNGHRLTGGSGDYRIRSTNALQVVDCTQAGGLHRTELCVRDSAPLDVFGVTFADAEIAVSASGASTQEHPAVMTVSNCVITSCGCGILVSEPARLAVADSLIATNRQGGIIVSDSSLGGQDLTILRTRILDSGTGVSVVSGTKDRANLRLIDTTVTGCTNVGVWAEVAAVEPSGRVLVTNNTAEALGLSVCNLALRDSEVVFGATPPADTSRIGVTILDGDHQPTSGVFSQANDVNYGSRFFSDSTSYFVHYQTGTRCLALEAGIQVGDNAWACIDGDLCEIVGAGDMWSYDKVEKSTLWNYRYAITNVIISENVTGVGAKVFDGWRSLRDVSMGVSCTNISAQAFLECFNLTNVTCAATNGLSIGDHAFYSCNSMEAMSFGMLPMFGTQSYTLQAGIYIKNGMPEVYPIPAISVTGHRMVLKGSTDLKNWIEITTEAEKLNYNFFKLTLEPVAQ